MKKNYLLLSAMALWSSFASAQGFFDQVTYKGAFGVSGSTKSSSGVGYNPDPSNTNANWTLGWTNWDPQNTAYGETYTDELVGDISSDKQISGLVKLSGTVHVKNGATLTILAGTTIRGNNQNTGTLIIAKGAKINAVGTASNPIVFTSGRAAGSRVAGDWGGILIIGNAQVNTVDGTRQYEALPNDPLARYGGGLNPNNADNSGVMRYVRLEFPGFNYLPDQELNGLTFGGVGSETKIDYIQVSYSRDDSFEWFGGKSNHKYLVAFAGIDDDFDMDEGYAGNVQFILGVRHPKVFETASGGTSNGFEHDNNTGVGTAGAVNPNSTNPTPNTNPTISNATLIGPIKDTDASTALVSGSKFGRAIELRSAVQTNLFNSVATGYATLMNFVSVSASITPSTQTKAFNGDFSFRGVHLQTGNTSGIVLFGTSANSPVSQLNSATGIQNWFDGNTGAVSTSIQTSDNVRAAGVSASNLFTSPFYTGVPSGATSGIVFTGVDYTLPTGSPLTTGTSWTDPRIANNLATINLVPTLGVSASALPTITIQTNNVTNNTRTFTVDAKNLTVTSLNIASSDSKFTVSPTSLTLTNGSVSGSITVTFATTVPGTYNTNITVSPNVAQTGISNIVVTARGTAVSPAAPVLSASLSSLTFSTAGNTSSAAQLVSVSGVLLNGNVTITAPAQFEVSTDNSSFSGSVTLTASSKTLPLTLVYVRYSPNATASHTGNVVVSAEGAAPFNVAVSGNSNPSVSLSTTAVIELQSVIGAPSREIRLTVTASKLQSDVTVTMPASFQVSSTTGLSGNWVSALTIPQASASGFAFWIRYYRTATGTSASTPLTLSGTNFNNVLCDLNGRTVGLTGSTVSGTAWSTSNASTSVTIAGIGTATGISLSAADEGKLLLTSSFAYVGVISTVLGTTGPDVAMLVSNSASSLNAAPVVLISTVSGATITYESGNSVATVTGATIQTGTRIFSSTGLVGIVSGVSGSTVTFFTAPSSSATDVAFYRVLGAAYLYTNTRSTSVMTNFGGTPSASSQVTIAVQGFNLTNIITLAAPSVFDLSTSTANDWSTPIVNNGSFTIATSNWANISTLTLPSNFNGNIYVRYNPGTSYASHTGDLALFSSPASAININVRGNSAPDLTVSASTLPLLNAVAGLPSTPTALVVTGSKLVGNVTLDAPANFQLSSDMAFTNPVSTLTLVPATTGSVNTSVYVRYLNTNASGSSSSSTINVNSSNAQGISVNVSGASTPAPVSFINLGGAATATIGGTAIEYTISGANLTSNVVVSASADYGVSLSNTTASSFVSSLTLTTSSTFFGDVASTLVYVKYLGTVDGVAGILTVTTTGANQSASLNSKVTSVIEEALAKSTLEMVVYPNPSEGNVTVDLGIGKSSDVSVLVYDLTGKLVSTLVSEKLALGTYSYSLSGLNSGVYYITLISSEGKKVSKLIVY